MVKAILLCILRTIHAIVACISIATSFVTVCYVTVYNVTVAVYNVVLTVTVCHAVLTVTVCHFVLLLLYVMLCCVTVTVCYFTCTSTPTIYVVLQCMFVFSTKNQQHAELNHVLKYVRTIYFILVLLYVMSCSTPIIYVVLQVWCSAPSFDEEDQKQVLNHVLLLCSHYSFIWVFILFF